MGRGKQLTTEEKKIISRMASRNLTIAEISRNTGRSRKVISNYLKAPEFYGIKKSPGRPHVLTAREKRAILRAASNSSSTARQIAVSAGVKTHARNIRRLLQRSPRIQRKKLQKTPSLSETHKLNRKVFAREHVQWTAEWLRVLFTDEKKFNLDGPDGWAYYYHDLRKEEMVFSKRQAGGGSVMIWAGIGFHCKTDIAFITGRMNSNDYISLLDTQLPAYLEKNPSQDFILQQDNAPSHTSKAVKGYLQSRNIEVIPWPARSPDLNIIENVWGQLARAVYKDCRQFQNIEELKKVIEEEWNKLPQEYIANMFHSLPNRMIAVLEKDGGFTGY